MVKDFHYHSLHTAIEPLVLTAEPNLLLRGASNVNFPGDPTPEVSVRLLPGDIPAALARVERAWKTIAPEQPFDYTFVDAALDAQYRQEARLGKVVGIASTLAIWIACLGLFGLALLTVIQRTKEIGIRKVLGASVVSIMVLLSKDFARLVLVAFVLAVPIAYYAMRDWLTDFAYHIDISGWIFLIAGIGALLVSLVPVGYHAARAALADPVESLRHE